MYLLMLCIKPNLVAEHKTAQIIKNSHTFSVVEGGPSFPFSLFAIPLPTNKYSPANRVQWNLMLKTKPNYKPALNSKTKLNLDTHESLSFVFCVWFYFVLVALLTYFSLIILLLVVRAGNTGAC